jgi:hypothetical protein
MKWLIYLYPKKWRKRYGEEFLYILENRKLSIVDIIDIFVNAIDTRILFLVKGVAYMEKKLRDFMNDANWKRLVVFGIAVAIGLFGGYWLANNTPSILQWSPKVLLLTGVGMGLIIGYIFGVVRGILRVVNATKKEDIFLPTGKLKFDKSSN